MNKQKNGDLVFQISHWDWYQEEDLNDDEIELNHYIIRAYGTTDTGKKIFVKIVNYKPYFFVEIPKNWRMNHVDTFVNTIKRKVWGNLKYSLASYKHIKKKKFWGFTNNEYFNFIQLKFTGYDGFLAFRNILNKPINIPLLTRKPKIYKLYESNIEPFLRCMHEVDLEACGWSFIKRGCYNMYEDTNKPSFNDINISVDYKYLRNVNNVLADQKVSDKVKLRLNKIAGSITPFIIASFDIECTSGDGGFPQPHRDSDQIIQIGTTFNRCGESECFFKHIITLGSCDPIEGVEVESYDSEKEVLIAWTKLIRRMNPDIITGYNIFGFDYTYLEARSKKIGCNSNFIKLGRIKNERATFIKKELASSALGVNKLYYYDMHGRIQIDLYKVIQKDFNLSSYKLDSVASNFIKEKIKEIIVDNDNNTTIIKTGNTYGLDVGRYITIYYNDGLTNNKFLDGQKFKILDLTSNNITVNGVIDNNELNIGKYSVFWCQAKDDVKPSDIFRLQRGTSKDRAVIASYCIQDCVLVNRLMEKLQILINNIGMANVTSVPLSYLFLRGQGVKIYSLVAKYCRKSNYLIPVISRPYNDDAKKTFEKDVEELIEDFCELKHFMSAASRAKLLVVLNKTKKLLNKKIVKDVSGINKFTFDTIRITKQSLDELYQLLGGNNNNDAKNDDKNETKIIKKKMKSFKKDSKIISQKVEYLLKYINRVLKLLNNGYEGATVLRPHVGVHFSPIAVLDYASLYPSSMIHRNISHECIVLDDKYRNHPAYDYYDITFYNNDGTKTTSTYAKLKNSDKKGIIPTILEHLLGARKKTKELIKTTDNKFRKQVLDGLQLAYKLTANSLYGQTGASTSPIYFKAIAASTTATGREMLNSARIFAEYVFPKVVKAVLNDDYDLYCRRINKVFDNKLDSLLGSKTIEKLRNSHYKDNDDPNDNSHLDRPSDYYYLRVFKEKKNKLTDEDFINKRLGHASRQDFIDYFYEEIRKLLDNLEINPECVYGDSVTSSTPVLVRNHMTKSIQIKTIENLNNYWKSYRGFKVNESNRREKQQNDDAINLEVWSDNGWTKIKRVIRHKCNKCIYRIFTTNGIVDVTEDHSLIGKNGNIIKPSECRIGTELLHTQLPINDINNSDLVNNHSIPDIMDLKNGILELTNQIDAMNIFIVLKKAGCNIKIITETDQEDKIMFKIINDFDDFDDFDENINKSNVINKIINMGITNDYVYDIETEHGRFNAGVGEITVKNTDSIFIDFRIAENDTHKQLTDHETLKRAIKIGILCGDLINFVLPSPQNLEYEKTFWPWISLSKKRYTGNLYEFDPDVFCQKSMGIVLKRRDNADIVKIVVGGIVSKILNDRSAKLAIEFTKKSLTEILSGVYPMEKFIITKTLKGGAMTADERIIEQKKPKEERIYSDRTRIVHAVLADRIADRDPGNKPQSNDRIPYVYIETKNKKIEVQGDRVEHPEYVIGNNLRLDYLFYITNQIMKPAIQFLEHVVKSPEKIFDSYILRETNRRKGKRPISYYYKDIKNKNNNANNEDNKANDNSDDCSIDDNDNIFINDDIDTLKKFVKKKNTRKNTKKGKKKNIKSLKSSDVLHEVSYNKKKGGFVLDDLI